MTELQLRPPNACMAGVKLRQPWDRFAVEIAVEMSVDIADAPPARAPNLIDSRRDSLYNLRLPVSLSA